MAFTQALVRRDCPSGAFEHLEVVIADSVGEVVYGDSYPGEADVDVAVGYARLGTFMALKVEIDTEDLPGIEGDWAITPEGLAVPSHSVSADERTSLDRVSQDGLDAKQWDIHSGLQGEAIRDRLIDNAMWNTGEIGWSNDMDPTLKLGVLVTRVEGAWRATYSE